MMLAAPVHFPPLAYIHDNGRLIQGRELVGEHMHHVLFAGSNIRSERTGVHALVEIMLDNILLGYDTFNVGRSEERGRLANRAYGLLNKAHAAEGTGYDKDYFVHDLDWFCRDLWAEHLTTTLPELTYGSTDRHAPVFRLAPYIKQNGGTIMFAPPGAGKSYTILLMAVSIDAGLSTYWSVEQTPVLFINLERSRQDVEDRLGDINQILGLERSRPLLVYHARGRALPDLKDHITRFIKTQGVGCLLLDSLSRAGMGSLIKDEVANEIVDTLNGFGIEWCALAHTSRSDDSHTFGSQHFDAGADISVMLASEQLDEHGPLGIGLSLHITHQGPRGGQRILAYEFDAAGLTGIRSARKGEFPEIEARKPEGMQSACRRELLARGEATATDLAGWTGYDRGNISRMLNSNVHTFLRTRQQGREVYFGVKGSV